MKSFSKPLICLLALLTTHMVLGDDFKDFLNATKRGDVSAVEAAIKKGMDPNKLDERGFSAFHLAAFWGQEAVLDLFLRGNHIQDINVPGHNGLRALHLAAGGGHTAAVQRLLQEPTLTIAIQNNDGLTPYNMAMGLNRIDVRGLLLADPRVDVDPNQDGVNRGWHGAGRRVYIYTIEQILAYPNSDLGTQDWLNLFERYQHAGDEQALNLLRNAQLAPNQEAMLHLDSEDDSDSNSNYDDDESSEEAYQEVDAVPSVPHYHATLQAYVNRFLLWLLIELHPHNLYSRF